MTTPNAPHHVLPGLNLTLGLTLFWLGLIVLLPLSAAFLKTTELSLAQFWHIVSAPCAVASQGRAGVRTTAEKTTQAKIAD